jgi:integrase
MSVKLPKINKYGLQHGDGQIVHLKDRAGKPWQARITRWDNIARKDKIIWSENYPTVETAISGLKERKGKTTDEIVQEKLTFEALYKEWRTRPSGMLSLAANSQKQLQSVYNAHCKALYNRKFVEIKTDDLQKIIDFCPAGYQTKNQIKTLLTYIYKMALQKEMTAINKAEFLYIGKDNLKSDEVIIFTDAEVRSMLKIADKVKNGMVAKLLFYTGMRYDIEALDLKTSNVDLENKIFYGFGGKTETGKTRKMPIHSEIFEFVKQRVESGGEYIFADENGERLKSRAYSRDFYNHMKQAGVDEKHFGATGTSSKTHTCRKTFISKLYEMDTERLITKKLAGHSLGGDVTDDRYTFVNTEKLREVIEKIRWEEDVIEA